MKNIIEPLHSIYNISLTENLEAYLKSDQSYAVRDYIKSLNVRYLQFEGSEKIKKPLPISIPSDIIDQLEMTMQDLTDDYCLKFTCIDS